MGLAGASYHGWFLLYWDSVGPQEFLVCYRNKISEYCEQAVFAVWNKTECLCYPFPGMGIINSKVETAFKKGFETCQVDSNFLIKILRVCFFDKYECLFDL